MLKVFRNLILLNILSLNLIFGQNTIDSLLQNIKGLKEEKQIEILTNSCWDYRSKNPRLALQYGVLALKKMNSIPKHKLRAKTNNLIGIAYGNLGKLDSAFYYYKSAFEHAKETNDSLQLGYSYNNIGDFYFKSSLFDMALSNIFRAHKIFEALNDKRGLGYTLNDIAKIYFRQNDLQKAQEYFIRSGEIKLSLNDKLGYANSLLHQAGIYVKLKKFDEALKLYNKALEYSRKTGYLKGNSSFLAGKSDVYFKQGLYDKALKLRLEALQIDLKINNKYGEIINYNQLGAIYKEKSDFNNAEFYLLKSLNKSEKSGYLDQALISYDLLREISLKKKNYKNAYHYFEKFEFLRNSIFSQKSTNKIADLKTAFITEQKEKQNQILLKDVELEKQNRNFLILILLLVSVVVFVIIRRYKSEKRINEKLNITNNELNELIAQKEKIFSVVGHDLKNPAAAIRNLLELLVEDYDTIDESKKKEILYFSHEASKKLVDLLIELLDWGMLSRGLVKIRIVEFNLYEVVKEIKELVSPMLSSKDINLEIKNCEKVISTDKKMITTVLRNFINNSIKYTPHFGNITVSCKVDKEFYYISTKDSGVGMKQENINNLFKTEKVTTTLGTDNEIGTGLGLLIANEFVKKCSGEIIVESEVGKGTNFILKIPINNI